MRSAAGVRRGLSIVALVTVLVAVLAGAGVGVAGGRFVDDDGNVHEGNIEKIAVAGITRGCNPPVNDRFCPDGKVTRGQMAAFLSRALHLPATNRDFFVDDDVSVFATDIDRLAAAGITRGCNPPTNDRYCPHGYVTRGQMAAFLVRGFVFRAGLGSNLFVDDDGSVFEGDIDRLGTAGVTKGCNPPANTRYCPEALVTRDQMASFLARALDSTTGDPAPTTTSSTTSTTSSTTSTTSSTTSTTSSTTSTTTTTTTTTFPPGGSVRLTFVGDLGARADSTATLNTVAGIGPSAHFLIGDLSYAEVAPESAWCDYVRGVVGPSLPFEVLVGNHEDDDSADGFIRDFAACMPDRLGVVGDYGVQYYADIGGVVRVIAVSPDLEVDGTSYRYEPGSDERSWLEAAVDDARSRGLWVVIAHHKVCVSTGVKGCEVGEELADWEAKNADLVVMGHEHNYQRSHQLSCVVKGRVSAGCVVDTDGDHRAGAGAVFVIAGTGGKERALDRSDPELGYFAATMGEGDPDWGHGLLRLDVSSAAVAGTFVASDSAYADWFMVRR